MASAPSFHLNHYRETLTDYINADYFLGSFEDILGQEPSEKYAILRHDVDYSLESALKMARIENELGVNSSFFVRVHAKGYNPFSLINYNVLKEIISMGHEIGLHLEPSMPLATGEDPTHFCNRQREVLESIIDKEISGIAAHEPSRIDGSEIVSELVSDWGLQYHAYEPRFFSEIKYISDSGARWREGCFSTWVNKEDKLQILTHPHWWFENFSQENY